MENLSLHLQDAAEHPSNWDVPGLLNDAALRLESNEYFLRRFLNPEDLGLAVSATIRDEIRDHLGQTRCES